MANYWSDTSFEKSLEFTPYQLPYQEVVNALQARTNYFIQGAQRIKNNYDSTFDFDLSNETNLVSLRKDKEQADKQIRSIVKSDLSIVDNQTRALDVLKPITSNTNYLQDEQLTKTIKSGLQQAQTDLKKNGAEYYNSLSVQAMQNTLNKWRTDNPDNYVSYADDTLGTQYQPYDPKVKQTFVKDLQTRVKNGKVKIDRTDGQGHIVTTEEVDLNSLDAIEYIKSIMPQQEKVQQSLQARVDLDNLSEMAQSPEGQAQVVGYFNSVKNFNIKTKEGFLTKNKNDLERAHAFLPDSDVQGKALLKTAIDSYTDLIAKVPESYSAFDDDAYINPNKIKQARNQVESLYLERMQNGLVSGLGLDQTSTTIKQDAAYFSQKNLDLAEKKFEWQKIYQSQDLAIKQALAAAKLAKETAASTVATGTNPLTYDTPGIVNADTAVTEADKLAVGQQVQTKIKGESQTIKNQSFKSILSGLQLNVRNADGFGNSDLLTAIDNAMAKKGNSSFSPILNSFTDQNSKNLVMALLKEGAALENKRIVDDQVGNMWNIQARRWITNALSNEDTFNKATVKAAMDNRVTSDGRDALSYINEIYWDRQKAEMLDLSNVRKFGPLWKESARAAGITDFENINDSNAFFYEGDNFIYARKEQFKKDGFTDPQIDALASYTSGKKTKEQILRENPEMGYMMERSLGLAGTVKDIVWNPQYGNVFEAMKGKWDGFQKDLNLRLSSQGGQFSNKEIQYSIYNNDQTNDKNFNPNEDIKEASLRRVLSNNVINNVEGQTDNPNFYKALKIFVDNGGISSKLLQNVRVTNDGGKAWLRLTPNLEGFSDQIRDRYKDLISEGGFIGFGEYSVDDFLKDLGTQKINIPLSVAKDDFRSAIVSPYTERLKSGDIFGGKLLSGSKIQIEDRGTDDNVQLYFTGSFKAPQVVDGKFRIKDVNFNTGNLDELMKTTLIGKTPEQLLNAFLVAPEDAGKHISYLDSIATNLKRILDKHQIDSTGEVDWNSLPQNVKDELRSSLPTLFGRR